MSGFLRQATASQEILLGPFLSDTDFKTQQTGLTIANTDIKLWKHGAIVEANKAVGGATHIASARYYAVLDAVDTDTAGLLEVNVALAGSVPVRRQFVVLPALVFDSLVYGTDNLQVDTIQMSGTAQTPGDTYGVLTGAQVEPGQGAPAANASPLTKLAYLFKGWRNKITQTNDTLSIYNDGGSVVDHKTTVSDDGTTFTRGKIGTGA